MAIMIIVKMMKRSEVNWSGVEQSRAEHDDDEDNNEIEADWDEMLNGVNIEVIQMMLTFGYYVESPYFIILLSFVFVKSVI